LRHADLQLSAAEVCCWSGEYFSRVGTYVLASVLRDSDAAHLLGGAGLSTACCHGAAGIGPGSANSRYPYCLGGLEGGENGPASLGLGQPDARSVLGQRGSALQKHPCDYTKESTGSVAGHCQFFCGPWAEDRRGLHGTHE